MFINLHVLYSLASANPNRDDTGAPKTLTFGGVERSRMSSQAMTRAKRRAYESDPNGELSYRSTMLASAITERAISMLEESGHPVDEATADRIAKSAAKAVSGLTSKKETDASADRDETDDGPKATLTWLAEQEIDIAARKIADKAGADLTADDFANTRTSSLAIAAFGRMFANRPDLQTEAAIQRADAFTTHRSDIDVDYFTAVDDLANGSGAGHLGTKMNTGGIYYWHATINTDELLDNWTDADSDDAHVRLSTMVRSLVTALPSGGQNTHAHHALPIAVLAVPATRPLSLANAYETPVRADRNGGYSAGSIDALSAEHAAVTKFDPGCLAGTPISVILRDGTIPHSEQADTLDAFTDRVANWIK